MRKYVFMAMALLAGHAAQAQYFCTEQGTELAYVNYDEEGQSVSNETVTVTNVQTQDGKKQAMYFVKIVEENKAKNNTNYTLYNWSYENGNSTCAEDLMYGPYIASNADPAVYNDNIRYALQVDKKYKGDNSFTLTNGMKAGEEMADRFYGYQSGMKKFEITISGVACLGSEEVNTKAGTFDCVKISYLMRTKVVVKSSTVRVTEWYAKGIGLVKSESYDMKGKSEGKKLLVKVDGK